MNTTLLITLRLGMVNSLETALSPRKICRTNQILQLSASKHLSGLHKSGVLEFMGKQFRRIYKLRPEPFKASNILLEQYREIWEERI
ncbi:transcriptional regulator [Peribacillus frigoritolerans]